jgi:hypothetical protein
VTTSHYFDTNPKLIGGASDADFVKFMRDVCEKETVSDDSTISASIKVTLLILCFGSSLTFFAFLHFFLSFFPSFFVSEPNTQATIDTNLQPDFTRPQALIDILVKTIGGGINPAQLKMLNAVITWATQWETKNKVRRWGWFGLVGLGLVRLGLVLFGLFVWLFGCLLIFFCFGFGFRFGFGFFFFFWFWNWN